MGCNWELFEFKVKIFYKLGDKSVPRHGTRYVGLGSSFENVSPDLRSLGIADFQGANDQCDFKSVFDQLIKLKSLPFAAPQKNYLSNHFSRVQSAEKNREHLPAAKLYVHRRDRSELESELRGVGIWFEGVDVIFTSLGKGAYYIHITGDDAGAINY